MQFEKNLCYHKSVPKVVGCGLDFQVHHFAVKEVVMNMQKRMGAVRRM